MPLSPGTSRANARTITGSSSAALTTCGPPGLCSSPAPLLGATTCCAFCPPTSPPLMRNRTTQQLPGAMPHSPSTRPPRPLRRALGLVVRYLACHPHLRSDRVLPCATAAVLAQTHLRALGCEIPDWAAVYTGSAAAPPHGDGEPARDPRLFKGWQRFASRACEARAFETHLTNLTPASRALVFPGSSARSSGFFCCAGCDFPPPRAAQMPLPR